MLNVSAVGCVPVNSVPVLTVVGSVPPAVHVSTRVPLAAASTRRRSPRIVQLGTDTAGDPDRQDAPRQVPGPAPVTPVDPGSRGAVGKAPGVPDAPWLVPLGPVAVAPVGPGVAEEKKELGSAGGCSGSEEHPASIAATTTVPRTSAAHEDDR